MTHEASRWQKKQQLTGKTYILIPHSSYLSINSEHLCSNVNLPFSSSLSRQFKTHEFPPSAKQADNSYI